MLDIFQTSNFDLLQFNSTLSQGRMSLNLGQIEFCLAGKE